MATTTGGGLPIPQGTDLLRDGDNAIANLGSALDARSYGHRLEHRSVAVTPNAAGGWGFAFARPFASPPEVVLGSTSTSGTDFMPVCAILAGGVTAGGVSGRAVDVTKGPNSSVTALFFIAYIAIGPDPTVWP